MAKQAKRKKRGRPRKVMPVRKPTPSELKIFLDEARRHVPAGVLTNIWWDPFIGANLASLTVNIDKLGAIPGIHELRNLLADRLRNALSDTQDDRKWRSAGRILARFEEVEIARRRIDMELRRSAMEGITARDIASKQLAASAGEGAVEQISPEDVCREKAPEEDEDDVSGKPRH